MESKTEIKVCMGSACFARGNEQNLNFLEDYIKENNFDVKLELCGSRCSGNCADGPNIFVNGIEYNGVTKDKIINILSELAL